ncbi:MAG: heavy metal translocating P-type ATPase [Ferrimicrobium sp.]
MSKQIAKTKSNSIRDMGVETKSLTPIVLNVTGMTCASCVGRVERALAKVDGVAEARVNLATEAAEVTVSGLVDNDALVDAVHAAGYEASLATRAPDPVAEASARRARRSADLAQRRVLLAFGVLGSTGILVATYGFPHAAWSPWVQLTLALPVWALVGWIFHQGALRTARHGTVNMDTLVSLGSTVALVYSIVAVLALPGRPIYFDVASLIVTLIATGKYLELATRGRAGEAIEALAGLQPDVAHLLAKQSTTGQGGLAPLDTTTATDVAVASLHPEDVVMIRPGERIPADALVIDGDGHVDESMLTGESIPVAKHVGDDLTGGTVNGLSPLIARVRRTGADSTLSRILHLVEQAQTEKSNAQRLADRVSSVFVPVILGAALLTFLGWLASGHSMVAALIPAVAVLVVACPCALGLATPVAVMVGTGRGAEQGLLIRGGETFERIREIGVVVLDKTGTLTIGHPEVTDLLTLDGSDGSEVLQLAASLEVTSEHPLARAIVTAATAQGLQLAEVNAVEVTPGGGIAGIVGEQIVQVGSIAWLTSIGLDGEAAAIPERQFATSGRTPVGVAVGGVIRVILGVADPIRENALAGVTRLHELGLAIVLASGDTEEIARTVAAEVGIKEIRAPLRPEDKADLVISLRERYGQVAMVGDGINDAPALAAADVGIAVGSGTGIAMAAADITLVHGDVGAVGDAIALSRATRRIIWQNLGWAFGYNVVLVPLAAFGILPPIFAALAMAFSSVSVVMNALRLRHFGRPRRSRSTSSPLQDH